MSTKITDHMLKGTSIRTLLQRAAAEAGFNLVDGSFEEGAVVTESNDVVWFRNEGTYYRWGGTIPVGGYIVPAGSTPATSGGVGALLWVDRTDIILRANLAASTGAGLVGTTDGITVQAKLNAIATDMANIANISDINAALALKANTSDVDTALALKANTSDVNAALALKANTSDLATKADTETVISRTQKGGLTTTVAGGAMTLKQAKRLFSFRNSVLINGTASEVTPNSDMTLTVPNGATLGSVSGVPTEYLEILLYNGGSPVVGIVNAACGLNLDESGLLTSSAISASATSATTIYSSVAVTNSPYIVLNRLTATQPTAGFWSVRPNIQSMDLTGPAMFTKNLLLPAIASTSGTTVGFTGIPSWAKKLTLMFNGVSTNATSPLLIKLGIGGIAQSSMYAAACFYNPTATVSTTGFYFGYRASATTNADGVFVLTKGSNLSWFGVGFWANTNAGTAGGSCTLTGAADSVFITTVTGNDVFDAGSISLLIEG